MDGCCYVESVKEEANGLEIRVCDLCDPFIPPLTRIFFLPKNGNKAREEGVISYSEVMYDVPDPPQEVWDLVLSISAPTS